MLAPWVAYGRNSGRRAIPGPEARRVVLFDGDQNIDDSQKTSSSYVVHNDHCFIF